MTMKKTARTKPPTSDTHVDIVGGGQAVFKAPATKTEPPPKPREQHLVMGDVDGTRMEWVFAKNGRVDFLDVNDGDGYHHFSLTTVQANALLEWLQDVVPLMQEAPADPMAPLVRYVP